MADNNDPSAKPQPTSLPVFWKTGGQVVSTSRSPVHLPTTQEQAVFGSQDVKTCGSCRHFRGDEQVSKEDAASLRGMVRAAMFESGWKRMFFGHKPEALRRCREDAELAVGPQSRACSRHSPR
jgi:hypothetical protein